MRPREIKAKRARRARPTVSARVTGHVTLEAQANGTIIACFDGYSVDLGRFSADAAERAQDLRTGLPLAAFASGTREVDQEIQVLVRRLARRGLLEYHLQRSRSDEDLVVIEPQVADYWPATPQLDNADVLVLSRFAYMRRRGNEMVLELPRAGALFKICNPKIASTITTLSTPQQIKQLRRRRVFRASSFLPCWSIAKSCSRSTLPASVASDRRKVTTTSFFGTFTIFCFTRAARKAGRPIR